MTTEATEAGAQGHTRPLSRPRAVPSPAEADHGASVPLDHLVVQDVRPSTPHGFPAKATVGQRVPVTANIARALMAVIRLDMICLLTARPRRLAAPLRFARVREILPRL